MNYSINRSIFIAAVIFAANILSLSQASIRSSISERNVRAHMYFLAGDAMQGRGSGTIFERITAEYVGSQFMQFGLEPAGDPGFDGNATFVQTVTITRNSFESNPTLKIGDRTFEHGKEMIVLRANSGKINADLHKIDSSEKPKPNGAAFVSPVEEGRNVMQLAQSITTAGSSIVIFEETPQHRSNWASMSGRRITFTVQSTPAKPSAIVIVSSEAAKAISQHTDGTMVEFAGQLAPPQKQQTWNAIGKITGSDAARSSEVVVLSSHLDHLGVRPNAPGDDKIFNGADDDASGTVAVIELARVLGEGKKPKRTVYFVCYGSEEAGGLGSNHFVSNMPFPKEKLVANLQFEMIGRPDAKVKPGELWLTGYDRSNLGPELAKQGAMLVADPHPEQNFFQRSDNYTLARQGMIAHTVSSFGLHTDYHRVTDENRTIDFAHMTRSIDSMVSPVQWLINSSFVPTWNEGKRP